MRPLTLLIALALLGALAGCDKKDDAFDQAPTARAPDAPAAPAAGAAGADAPAPQGAGAPTAGALRAPALPPGAKLPADHPPVPSGASAAVAADGPPPSMGSAGPLRWKAPVSWKAARPAQGSMRLGEYIVSPGAGLQPAVMTIFYFGQGQGGGVEDNINRWVGQFKDAQGQPAKAAARDTRTISGMKAHTVDVSGTFNGGMAMGGGQDEPDQRMLAAIVESPQGNFFFKLLGPKATVDAEADNYEAFLASMSPGE